ncbi:MAG TPA: helix-turn-helix domain-containing protein [Actinomycetota bacterium]|nr:helix-turn-helix domain-containing protein [Actinomycetota bacterium]
MATKKSRELSFFDEALSRVFGLLGKRWTGMIIGSLCEGPSRFAEIARGVPGITEGMLSSRLQELQDAGIVEREVLAGPPLATVYRLTERGRALEPALLELARWAETNLQPDADSR